MTTNEQPQPQAETKTLTHALYLKFSGAESVFAGNLPCNESTPDAIVRARKIVEALREVGIQEFMVEVVFPEVEQTVDNDAFRVPFRYQHTVRRAQPVAA